MSFLPSQHSKIHAHASNDEPPTKFKSHKILPDFTYPDVNAKRLPKLIYYASYLCSSKHVHTLTNSQPSQL